MSKNWLTLLDMYCRWECRRSEPESQLSNQSCRANFFPVSSLNFLLHTLSLSLTLTLPLSLSVYLSLSPTHVLKCNEITPVCRFEQRILYLKINNATRWAKCIVFLIELNLLLPGFRLSAMYTRVHHIFEIEIVNWLMVSKNG